ncbi:MAG: DUF1488 domain-containing protein [Hyphomicrobiales bacterium]|nr:DUF1488 domain-containing protein [Hyphomicrobiales bacterium]
MTLNFPNESRNFDSKRNRVQFWGYDGAIEVSFFVGADALQKLGRLSLEAADIETRVLSVFDAARARIHQVAEKVYGRARAGDFVHCLVATDF